MRSITFTVIILMGFISLTCSFKIKGRYAEDGGQKDIHSSLDIKEKDTNDKDVMVTDTRHEPVFDIKDTIENNDTSVYDTKPDIIARCHDQDGDGYGIGGGCLGEDCDDTDPLCNVDCSDRDNDGIYDCKDDCIDSDGDGYGEGSGCFGEDCDDTSPQCNTDCSSDYDHDGIPDCRDNFQDCVAAGSTTSGDCNNVNCCGEAICTDSLYGTKCCYPQTHTCTTDEECCTDYCIGGICDNCRQLGQPCNSSDDCCGYTGMGNSDVQCYNNTCCLLPGARCNPSEDQCCGNLRCDCEFPGIDDGNENPINGCICSRQ